MKETIVSLPGALGTSILGFSIVFFILVVLMVMITVLRSVLEQMAASKTASAAPAAAAAVAAPVAAPAANMIPAKGSLGEIKLFDVDDKTAAMIMAIVADKMDAPLNTLRFLSIREKK